MSSTRARTRRLRERASAKRDKGFDEATRRLKSERPEALSLLADERDGSFDVVPRTDSVLVATPLVVKLQSFIAVAISKLVLMPRCQGNEGQMRRLSN